MVDRLLGQKNSETVVGTRQWRTEGYLSLYEIWLCTEALAEPEIKWLVRVARAYINAAVDHETAGGETGPWDEPCFYQLAGTVDDMPGVHDAERRQWFESMAIKLLLESKVHEHDPLDQTRKSQQQHQKQKGASRGRANRRHRQGSPRVQTGDSMQSHYEKREQIKERWMDAFVRQLLRKLDAYPTSNWLFFCADDGGHVRMMLCFDQNEAKAMLARWGTLAQRPKAEWFTTFRQLCVQACRDEATLKKSMEQTVVRCLMCEALSIAEHNKTSLGTHMVAASDKTVATLVPVGTFASICPLMRRTFAASGHGDWMHVPVVEKQRWMHEPEQRSTIDMIVRVWERARSAAEERACKVALAAATIKRQMGNAAVAVWIAEDHMRASVRQELRERLGHRLSLLADSMAHACVA